MLKALVSPGILSALVVAALFGFPWEGQPMSGEAGEFQLVILGHVVQHPLLLMLVIGIFLGWIIFPLIGSVFRFRGNWNDFRNRIDNVYDSDKNIFHTKLNHAYEIWRKKQENVLPINLDELVRSSRIINKRALLSERVDKIIPALKQSNKMLWNFSEALYKEIQACNRSTDFAPELMRREDCEIFSISRKHLTSFWDKEAERILTGAGIMLSHIWLLEMRRTLQEDIVFIILPFLETALAKELGHKYIRAKHIFRLCLNRSVAWRAANT